MLTTQRYLIFHYGKICSVFTIEIYKVNTAAFMTDIIPVSGLFFSLVSKSITTEEAGCFDLIDLSGVCVCVWVVDIQQVGDGRHHAARCKDT